MNGPSVLHLDLGRSWRGGQQQAYLLHRELRARAVDSRLAAPEGSELLLRCRREGLPVFGLPGRSPWNPRVAGAVRRFAAEAAILHAHDGHSATVGAVLKALRPGLRLVCHRRVSYPPGRGPWARWKYRRPDAWVAVSQEVGAAVRGAGVAAGRVRVVHSAIDLPALRAGAQAGDRAELRRALSISADAPVVGFCAAFSPQKGHGVLVEAAAEVLGRRPETVFLLPGEGDRRAHVGAAIRRHGLSGGFRLPGHRSDVAALTALFTVGVVPSVDGEGSSASIKEPMALGIPVVASDLPGNLEVLGDGGVAFRNRDAADLAAALLGLLADPGLRADLGARARRRSERFSPEAMTEGVLSAYREILG